MSKRSARGGHVMASLARARPARLDAEACVRNRWPDASEIIEAAGPAEPGQGSFFSKIHLKPPGWASGLLAHPGHRKLIGAVSSAVVMAVAIVIAASAYSLVLGSRHPSGPVRPGHSAPPGPSSASAGPIKFRPLRLSPGWHGRVAYAVRDGIVYLTGTARPSGRSLILARLPPALRPASELDIVVGLGSEGDGAIKVAANGQLRVYAPQSRITFVSLDGVSFAAG